MEAERPAARSFLPWVRGTAFADLAIGVLVLIGWTANVRVLKQISPDLPAMKPNTAAMMIVTGLGVLAIADDVRQPRRVRLGALAGGFVTAVAGLTLLEYLWRNVGIDELVFHDSQGADPGRPSPHTALVFLLVGVNLLLLDSSRRSRRLAPLANTAAAATLTFGIIGYAYDVDYLRGASEATGISVQALIGLTLAVVGLALIEPRRGWVGVLTAPGPGGRMARLFAPIVVLMPVFLGLELRWFDSTWGRAVVATTITAVGILVLFRAAVVLERTEEERVQLAGLLPICAHCKRIRDEQGYWNALETYIETHSEATFSHGLCSNCLAEHYPDVAGRVEQLVAESEA